jgi:hypothetical protein
MFSLPDVILIFVSVAALATALYAIRRSDKRSDEMDRQMDAHMRALDVLNDPDLNSDSPSEDDGPIARRKKMHLLTVVAVTPGAVDWLRRQARAHPAAVVSVVTLAAAVGYVALIWPQRPEPSMSMDLPQPPPIVSTTVIVLTPVPPAGTSPQAAPAASVPVTSGALMTSTSATLVAEPTTPARTAVPSTSGRSAPTSAPSVPTTTQPTLVPACALAVETDAVKPCAIVK